ncbi:MAG: YciI family protein [Burkholderiaceae bacterium]
MKYLCLVYLDQENWNACPDPTCFAYVQTLQQSGHLVAGDPLHPVHTATTVRMRNGQVSVTDGPFAETKEALAGYYLIDAKDLNEAIQIAAKIPPAKYGSIEVRPVRTLQVDAATE